MAARAIIVLFYLFFFWFICRNGAKSCPHLHKHKYLLLWFLIAVIKEEIERIRCLLHNYKALNSPHTSPQYASGTEDDVQN